ncbi:MAG: Cof-type HAD-IIB family hydrolase [Eubacteriales bacterium]|nr:Cof-type HAD-IIB family hydrolase [Eubacteriales bacterium]
MRYGMIVLDLDGTLTNRDKVITERTRRALMEAQKRGVKVVLASGRPTYGVVPLAEELELEHYGGYVLSFNGGIIMDCRTGKTIFQKKLPVESNRRIIELAHGERVSAVLTYEGAQIITDNQDCSYVKLESSINHLKIRQLEKLEEHVNFAVPKFIMTDDGDYLALVEARVKAALGRDFSVYRSEPFFLEILPRGIDKAQSLGQLLRALGMEREEMIACGDGYNDISMIRFAGLGVAMENAVLPVRKEADYVTLSNNDDGVAHVVEKFLLS